MKRKYLVDHVTKHGAYFGIIRIWHTEKGYAVEQWDNDWDDTNKIEYYAEIPNLLIIKDHDEFLTPEIIGEWLNNLKYNFSDYLYRTVITYKGGN